MNTRTRGQSGQQAGASQRQLWWLGGGLLSRPQGSRPCGGAVAQRQLLHHRQLRAGFHALGHHLLQHLCRRARQRLLAAAQQREQQRHEPVRQPERWVLPLAGCCQRSGALARDNDSS